MIVSLVLAAGLMGCAQEREPLEPPRAHSSRVAMTVSYPGLAPWALITYERGDGERCSALGTLTGSGPRVLRAPGAPLEEGLAGAGRCLGTGGVTLDVSATAGGDIRVVGGIAARGVRRVLVGGERVRPGRSGAFLVTQPGGTDTLGDKVEVEWATGERRRVAIADVTVPN